MKLKLGLAVAAALALSACATTPPEPLRGTYQNISVSDAQARDYTGSTVAWGGIVAKTIPMQGQTCFEVVATQLDSQLRPRELRNDTLGRFMACRTGFYDPAVFAMNREVTFVGRLNGYSDQKIGDYSYRYPKLDADKIYLWPKRVDRMAYPYGPYGYGSYGWGGWGWGMGYGWPWW